MPIGAALAWDDDHCYVMIVSARRAPIWWPGYAARRKRRQARIGMPDAALTPNTGLAAVSELCDRLGVIEALDAAVGRWRASGRPPGRFWSARRSSFGDAGFYRAAPAM